MGNAQRHLPLKEPEEQDRLSLGTAAAVDMSAREVVSSPWVSYNARISNKMKVLNAV